MPWNTVSDFSDGVKPTHTKLNQLIENAEYLKDPDVRYLAFGDGSGDYSTVSTSYVAVGSPFSYTATFKEGYVLVIFRATTPVTSGSPEMFVDIDIDGTLVGADHDGGGREGLWHGHTNRDNTIFIFRLIPVTAGSHTIAVHWRTSANTAYIENDGIYPMFYVRELAWTP